MMINEKLIEFQKDLIRRRNFFLIIMWSLLMISPGLALSDPVNQSLSEFNNFTRADNLLEITQELNIWVGGLFGIVILILIFAVSFTMTLFFRNDTPKALMFSLFITTVTSILLYVVNLVPDQAVFFCVPLFLISVVFTIIAR